MTKPKTSKLTVNGVKLAVARHGKGGRPPLVCVHGLTANLRCFDTIAAPLSKTREVVAYDLRGRGLSDKPDAGYDVVTHAEDLAALVDKIGGPVCLLGHSLGASIVLACAARHPEKVSKLVLADGAGKLGEAQARRVFEGIRPSLARLDKVFPSVEDYLAPLKKTPFLRPWSRALDDYFNYELEKAEGGVRSRVRSVHVNQEIMNLAAFKPAEHYAAVQCPALVLRAPQGMLKKNDILLPKSALRRMAGSIKNVWIVDLAETNHYSIVFMKNRTRDRALATFLDS